MSVSASVDKHRKRNKFFSLSYGKENSNSKTSIHNISKIYIFFRSWKCYKRCLKKENRQQKKRRNHYAATVSTSLPERSLQRMTKSGIFSDLKAFCNSRMKYVMNIDITQQNNQHIQIVKFEIDFLRIKSTGNKIVAASRV